MIASSILMFGIIPAMLTGNGISYGIRLSFKLPLIWAMLFGLSLHFLNIKLPLQLDKGIQ